MRAIIHCSRFNTDGIVRHGELAQIKHKIPRVHDKVSELIEKGRWAVHPLGWEVLGFLEYNPSKEKVEKDRAAARDRQREFRARNAVTNKEVAVGTGRESRQAEIAAAIAACDRCDRNGWIELPDKTVDKCCHAPGHKSGLPLPAGVTPIRADLA